MRRLATYISIALLTFVIGISVFVFWWWNYSHRPTPETFQAKISAYNQLFQSEIPEGSSVSEVKAFLDRQRINHSELNNSPETESNFHDLEFPNKQAIIKGYIVSMVRDVDYEPLTRWDIQLWFYFDR